MRLGMLTPLSNTVLEPMMAALAADLPGTSVHFGRFRVTEIALSETALGQFSLARMTEAAELLGHARVDAIAWNGTSAAWLGFARDEALCAAIQSTTGIPSTTSVLAFRDLFRATGARRIAPFLEREFGLPVYVSIAATLWGSLALLGKDARGLAAWGSMFAISPASGRHAR
ncbi:hypothetical protein F6X51_10130 [Methylobacterium planeticum]|uniref:Asp/Glu/hydantoin racemase n=1 Tax=Methylobacterium planeticum TaxID=2615211 RepID=A0A6N6MR33_9HYPH|nr:hypothetical protein F6X51_10130 [Methylobacterium planeticum]